MGLWSAYDTTTSMIYSEGLKKRSQENDAQQPYGLEGREFAKQQLFQSFHKWLMVSNRHLQTKPSGGYKKIPKDVYVVQRSVP